MQFLKSLLGRLLAVAFAAFAVHALAAGTNAPREKLLLDFNWKFHLGDDWPNMLHLDKAGQNSGPASDRFNDNSWRPLNLPHDWAIELPFDKNSDANHGFKPVGPGYPKNSVGWYRRTFDLPASDAGKRIRLEFDGVFRDAEVFVNGWFVGHHESGYSSFGYDITDVARAGGSNTVAVRVDATKFEGWFYEGAGIYRHVWLVKTAPLAIAPDGIFVYSQFKNNVPGRTAEIHVETRLLNTLTNAAAATVKCEIISPDGKSLATFKETANVKNLGQRDVKLESHVTHPELWSPETPKLYHLITTVESGGKVVDGQETAFGIRTVAFDVTNGFLLNGKHYELKGTCNHQDMAGVGAALPDALQYFRIAKLKEFGDNAYRTSHNPPTPELLDACDRLGMIVMDENRLLGSDEENLRRFEQFIRRDRSHPSVGIWSICNEETTQTKPVSARVGGTMQSFLLKLDATRPVTAAESVGDVFTGLQGALQVRGWNYHIGKKAGEYGKEMDSYHAKHPNQPEVGTEQGSTVSTRGIYANDKERGYVSAYDVNAPSWANTAEEWWSIFADRPWLSGGFVWTGFDYRGEPTPYSWPCVNSHFGILDTCGFWKDIAWYYQAWWTTNTVLHLLPHWNWPGKEGQEIRVDAFSNCKQVELFLNGTSLGKQTMKPNSKLSWQVKYAPGTLSAKGFDAAGKVIAETKVETTGDPAAIQLTPNRATIAANGEDVSVITVAVTDAQGRIVPVASNKINFSLEGAGKILGVGNGDPSCHEPDTFIPVPPVKSVPFNDWRWTLTNLPARAGFMLPEYAAGCDDSAWDKASSEDDAGQLTEGQTAIFRQHLNVSAEELTNSSAIQIAFGRIDDRGWIYVNGRRVGESHDWAAAPAYEIKSDLLPGDNVIAVGVQNTVGTGGLGLGVNVQFAGQPVTPAWSRSVFNGLAQIIVESTKDAGEIKLAASADGLAPATATLQTKAGTPRPFVP